MSAVVWHATMSLDGFIAGPDDAMEWAFEHGAVSPLADEVMATTGAILGGRRCYDVATERYGGGDRIYGGAWRGPVFVLTHLPPAGPAHPAITFVSDGVEGGPAAPDGSRGRQERGDLRRQCRPAGPARRGLLDEIVVHLAPVLLGDGTRFYEAAGARAVTLDRTSLDGCGQMTDLRFLVPAP